MTTHRWHDRGLDRSEVRPDDGPAAHYVAGWFAGYDAAGDPKLTVGALFRRVGAYWIAGFQVGAAMRKRIAKERR